MRSLVLRHLLTLVRVATLLALLTSTALLWHYLAPSESASFCGVGSGCEAVRKHAPKVFGLSHFVPLAGVVGFALLFWSAFLSNPKRTVLVPAVIGGAVAVGLLLLQAVSIGEFCWMCVVVDMLGIGIALAAIALFRTDTPQAEPIRGWAWAGLFALAINTPTAWDKVRPADDLPEALQQLQEPGKLTVVEFVDLQCPHCRRFNPILEAELARSEVPVAFHRVHVPLSIHPLAETAARAAVCAHHLGKGEEMEERLLTQPLVPEVWFAHAVTLGLGRQTLEECLQAERTDKTVAEHRALFDATGSHSLPLTFVGNQRIQGAGDAAIVHRAVRRALEPRTAVPGWLFVSALCALSALLIGAGRWRRKG